MTEKDALPTYGMPQPESSGEANEKPQLSPIQRLSGIFLSPGEVFADINRKPDFVLPIIALVVLALGFTFFFKWRVPVNPEEIARRAVEQSLEKQGKRWRDLSDQQREQFEKSIQVSATIQKILPFTIPALVPVGLLIMTLFYYVGTLLIRGQTSFGKVFSVTAYASFATDLVQYVLSGIIIGLRPPDVDTIIRSNGSYAMSNPAAFFGPETAGWILAFARSFDFFKIWFIILMAIGLAAICYKKRPGQAAVIPVGLWLLGLVLGVGAAILFRT